MIKIAKRNLQWWAVVLAVLFMVGQVVCDLTIPTLTSEIINRGVVKQDLSFITHEGWIMMGVALIGLLMAIGNIYFAATQAMKVGKNLRAQIYQRVFRFSEREMSELGTSSLITRSTNDVVQIQNVIVQMLRMMIQSPIMLVAACFLAYQSEPRLTKIFLISLPILAVVIIIIMSMATPLFKSIQKKIDRINLIFREGLTGVRVIRAFNQDDYEQERFKKANRDYTDTGIKAFTLVSLMFPVMTLILSLTNVSIIWMGSHLIANMTMEVGDLIAFLSYAVMILISFMMLSMIFVMITLAGEAARRIVEVLDTEPSLANPAEPVTEVKDGSIDFENVSFKYRDDAEVFALEDINLHIASGQTVGILGGTGSAKTTLIQLISRLYDVSVGSVKVGGVDVRSYDMEALRNQVSVVLQKNVLFSGTIKENLRWGDPDATDEEMVRICRLAQADEFIQTFPDKYDTYIEQGGANVSGGQKQRLCIARALLKKPKILILDDSTSAVDTKTDALIRKAFREEIPGTTKLIIAQRIASIQDADLILVMDGGRVVAQGDHAHLLETSEIYREVYDSQTKGGSDIG